MTTQEQTGLGMIDRKYNLSCEDGHRHFSPTPEGFVGQQCQTVIPVPIGTKGSATKCTSPMSRLPGVTSGH